MKASDLFSLELIDSAYSGYFFDRQMKLYEETYIGAEIVPSNRKLSTENHPYDIYQLRTRMHAGCWASWTLWYNAGTAAEAEKSDEGVYIIGKQDSSGQYCFASNPKVHKTEESVRTECERLAKVRPGEKFVYFKCGGSCVAADIIWS